MALLHDPGPPPAVIILEVDLPRIDGYEVVKQLRKKGYTTIALVLLSKRDGVFDRVQGLLAGANAYLTKPFTIKQVLYVIRSSLGLPVPEGWINAPAQGLGHVPLIVPSSL